ncbi:Arc family DNA-binding protein [Brucella sp. 6810]|uniref:Arc family DNA-binding protein n=1 Tax=Brucella sp. 6810 TaxID=2769351 RepID=UPI00165B82B0|nr:Arc family DNA-binding protein [Brucella sp. 6810]QNQ62525.1 Arc family DNA-binding protein [Brucella sp. 6810]
MAKPMYPSEKLDQYMLRFPDGMRERLKTLAKDNNRTLNAEIIARLEASFSSSARPQSKDVDPLVREMADELMRRLEERDRKRIEDRIKSRDTELQKRKGE